MHTACAVIDIHCDYLDTRILNTPEELPATLRLYAFGTSAVVAERWESLHRIFSIAVLRENRQDKRALVPIWVFVRAGRGRHEGAARPREAVHPVQNHVSELLFELMGSQFDSRADFDLAFGRFVIFAALAYAAPQVAILEPKIEAVREGYEGQN